MTQKINNKLLLISAKGNFHKVNQIKNKALNANTCENDKESDVLETSYYRIDKINLRT